MRKQLIYMMLATAIVPSCIAQAHDRHQAENAASANVHAVRGGSTIEIKGSYDTVFESLVSYLQREGYSIDSANKDSGLVATAMEITGGWRQTGKRLVISVIKDTSTNTTVRVASTVQKRYKGIQMEAWNDPIVDDKASADAAQKIQTELPARLVKN